MFTNYIIVAWRNIQRSKGYSFINISGLAVGMAVFIATLIYVNHETSFDQWDKQLANAYRLNVAQTWDGSKEYTMWTSAPLGPQLLATSPEVQAVTRIADKRELLISTADKQLYINKIMGADSSFLDVLPYHLKYGSAASALKAPNTAIVNKTTSLKLFGTENSVGHTFKLVDGRIFTVTGITEDNTRSHLDFNICLSAFASRQGNWSADVYITYVLLKPGADATALSKKARLLLINGLATYSYNQQAGRDASVAAPGNSAEAWLKNNLQRSIDEVALEPVANIHLYSKAAGYRDAAENHPLFNTTGGNDKPILFFATTALLILILACINYTNLAVARAGKRAREAGVRKAIGAQRYELIGQFLTEAFLQSLIALAIGLILAKGIISVVNTAFNMQLDIFDNAFMQQNWKLALQLLTLVIVVSLFSGGYPAFILSSFRAAKVLKGEITKSVKGRYLQNGLIVLQFAISTCFVIGMTVVYLQLNYMRSTDPGFNTSQVLVLHPYSTDLIDPSSPASKLETIKHQLSQLPGVSNVAVTDFYPGTPSNVTEAEASFNERPVKVTFNFIHFDYFKTLDIKFVAGRDLSTAYALDSVNSAVINETAARVFAGKDPIGQQIETMGTKYTVVGVVKDNHIAGFNTLITPEVYGIGVQKGLFGGYRGILVKVSGGKAVETTEAISKYWKTIEPNYPLRYTWLDHDFAKLITRYEQLWMITILLAAISTIIALKGIFALSAFAASQRTREIAIRKIFGASVTRITTLLTMDFLKLTLLALLIAFPVALIISKQWLMEFAYQVPINSLIFVLAGLTITALALLTVGIQALKAAVVNPAKSLKAE
ncbi:MAG: ABC transporter permease [Chitinophagaceae bacterium]